MANKRAVYYPEWFPCPTWEYSQQISAYQRRTPMESGWERQRKDWPQFGSAVSLTWQMSTEEFWRWSDWVESNGHDWFYMDLDQYGSGRQTYYLRLSTDIAYDYDDYDNVTVRAQGELGDPLFGEGSEVPHECVPPYIIRAPYPPEPVPSQYICNAIESGYTAINMKSINFQRNSEPYAWTDTFAESWGTGWRSDQTAPTWTKPAWYYFFFQGTSGPNSNWGTSAGARKWNITTQWTDRWLNTDLYKLGFCTGQPFIVPSFQGDGAAGPALKFPEEEFNEHWGGYSVAIVGTAWANTGQHPRSGGNIIRNSGTYIRAIDDSGPVSGGQKDRYVRSSMSRTGSNPYFHTLTVNAGTNVENAGQTGNLSNRDSVTLDLSDKLWNGWCLFQFSISDPQPVIRVDETDLSGGNTYLYVETTIDIRVTAWDGTVFSHTLTGGDCWFPSSSSENIQGWEFVQHSFQSTPNLFFCGADDDSALACANMGYKKGPMTTGEMDLLERTFLNNFDPDLPPPT